MASPRAKKAVAYLRRELERIRRAHKSYISIPEDERSEFVRKSLIELGAQGHMLSTHIDVLEEILFHGR